METNIALWRNYAFELWCWRRLLRVLWTARRSNQSILKELSPKYSLEELMLKLKLQYFGHLMWRTDSLEKTLMLGKIEGRRRGDNNGWDGWMTSPTQQTWVWASSGRWWRTGKPGVLQSMGSQRVRHNWAAELNFSIILKKEWGRERYDRRESGSMITVVGTGDKTLAEMWEPDAGGGPCTLQGAACLRTVDFIPSASRTVTE